MAQSAESPKRRSEKRKRNFRVNVRMTNEEFAHLKMRAGNAGKGRQDFIRSLVAESKLKAIPIIPPEVYPDMAAMANNINQLARKANAGAPISTAALNEMRDTFKEMIRRMSSTTTEEKPGGGAIKESPTPD